MKKISFALAIFATIILLFRCQNEKEATLKYPNKTRSIAPDRAKEIASNIESTTNVELNSDFELSLWASDSLIQDPIAISIDPNGKIYYPSATRQTNSEFDIRGHRNWMTASMSFQTIEDRSKFLKETFSETNEEGKKSLKDLNEDGELDWRDLTIAKEQVWVIDDKSKDGVADFAQLYLEDFNEEITDVANGIEYSDGVVYISVGPDIWSTKDNDGDGIADETKSLSRGYAVHIGFSGHGMSGAIRGPDGRVYWGIGDIGANVTDQTGKHWKYPNRGVIARSEVDGSGFEIFCHGVRNTHEFVFDKYGNLISEDNDGDHQGERERLVYLINGSDTGWRINWQYGKYTDPKNNTYKVWMDEKMHVPHWDGQAAYFLPTISNYINGPTGMVYNPGTALSPKYYDHFFIAEFRGSPSNSPIHAFTLKQKGAGFELDTTMEIVKGLLPTGLDFGPEGSLYFGDWIDGWGTKDAGRIWKLDIPGEKNSSIRKETKELIEADFSKMLIDDISSKLSHQDMRVRQKAQFELAKRGEEGYNALSETAKLGKNQLARIHSIWGMTQMSRLDETFNAKNLINYLSDNDNEIKAQAAKMLGDLKYEDAKQDVIELLQNSNARVQLMAIEALGRMEAKNAFQPIVDVINKNNDEDLWIRHAGMVALGRIGNEEGLSALNTSPSKAVRTAAVVALRRMESPRVAVYLNDADEFIVAEAARAINDDFSIEEAMPDLAALIEKPGLQNEATLRRSINANVRVGNEASLKRLANYADNKSAPPAMRGEALEALRSWESPSVFDRVDGRYRGELIREAGELSNIITPRIPSYISDKNSKIQVAGLKMAAQLNATNQSDKIFSILKNTSSSEVKIAALNALNDLDFNQLSQALEISITDKDENVRARGLEILPESDIEESKAINLFAEVLKNGSVREKQSVLSTLSNLKSNEAVNLLGESLQLLKLGKADNNIQLDIAEAIDSSGNKSLIDQLKYYNDEVFKDDTLGSYNYTLKGGDWSNGRNIFNNHESAQCVKCHTIFEHGGNAGPGLAGVADRLSPVEILEAVVYPSLSYAAGYEVASLELKDDEIIAGFIMSETDDEINIKVGNDLKTIAKSGVLKRNQLPSSMPPMGNILTKREIRDLMSYLGSLHEEI